MNRAGAVRLQGHYSGGHDEGGLESFSLEDKDGNKIDTEAKTWEDPLWQAVENLLSTKFYSWALEHYVNGMVFVDLEAKRAWTDGDEEVTDWQPDADPIDLRW